LSAALDGLDEAEARLLRPAAAPEHAGAMKAVLTRERFSDPDWIFERKLDGIRCVAIRSRDRLRMLSRNDLSLNARYPELARALAHQRCERFAVDGEVVAFEGSRTSFAEGDAWKGINRRARKLPSA
jgi:bifunctional non-homologous end joining protein LigD